jgi:glutamyl-tRNA synthetase
VFDLEKLEWLNGEHLRAMSPGQFTQAALDHLSYSGSPLAKQPERVAQAAPLVQEKLRVLSQFEGMTRFLFGPVEVSPEAWERVAGEPEAGRGLGAAREALADLDGWVAEAIERALRGACDATGLKPRVLFAPVRVAVTGSNVSPGLFESLELVGREESLARLDSAIQRLS